MSLVTVVWADMLATTLCRLLGIMASPVFAMRLKMMASSGWMCRCEYDEQEGDREYTRTHEAPWR